MPKCKYCHRNISSFDTDICPYCGEKNPIEENYKTKDITQFVDPIKGEYELYKSKSKKKAVILMATLGMFGAPYFYLGNYKKAVIILTVSIILIVGFGFLLYYTCLNNALAFLIPFFCLLFIYGLDAIFLSKNDTLKDCNGEFLR